jgi:hypothetical protein
VGYVGLQSLGKRPGAGVHPGLCVVTDAHVGRREGHLGSLGVGRPITVGSIESRITLAQMPIRSHRRDGQIAYFYGTNIRGMP